MNQGSHNLPPNDYQQLPPGGPGMGLGMPSPDMGTPHQQVNVFKVLHNLYRGRYVLAGALAAGGVLAGVVAGWLSKSPLYESKATILVQPLERRVMDSGADVRPMFESFVNREINVIQQDRTIRQAITSDAWKAMGRPVGQGSEQIFRDQLSVRLPSRSTLEVIEVTVSDKDPQAAFIGVTELCKAYMKVSEDSSGDAVFRKKDQIRESSKRQYEQKIADYRNRVKQLAQELGTDEPGDLNRFLVAKRLDISTQIQAIDTALIARGWAPPTPEKPNGEEKIEDVQNPEQMKKPEDMTLEEIATVDSPMATLLAALQEAQSRKAMELQRGIGESHRFVKRVQSEIDATIELMNQRREEWLGNRPAGPSTIAQGAAGMESTDALLRRRSSLERQFRDTLAESSDLAGKIQEMAALKQNIAYEESNLEQLRRVMENERRDQDLQRQLGRIEVLTPEFPPVSPTNDSRIKFAAVFGFLGAMLPLGIIGVYGLFDRRYRYSDEAIEEGPSNTTLLGILPRLPADLSDAEQATAAAHCVHQIRALVQIGGKHRKVYAVTSSNPGDGKTSMTLALGLSFASSGSRTLLVDLDLIGQGLSRGLRAREQSSLFNVLVDGDMNARVRKTHMDNLWILPTGIEDDHRSANRLAEPQITRLIDAMRDQYDIVLIDTGPVLGSIEAHLVCAQADGVLLVVGAGRARGQVKNAVDQLRRVNARLLGLVFNLAQAKDFRTSAASQSFRSVRPDGVTPQPPDPSDFPEMEPLPRVVALDTKR
jgi:capsular exopolysaccharide synthesis family protein